MDEIFEKYQKSSNLYCKQVDSDRVYIYNSYSKTGSYLNNKELFKNFISDKSVIIPDGVGVQISAKILKTPVREKIIMT